MKKRIKKHKDTNTYKINICIDEINVSKDVLKNGNVVHADERKNIQSWIRRKRKELKELKND